MSPHDDVPNGSSIHLLSRQAAAVILIETSWQSNFEAGGFNENLYEIKYIDSIDLLFQCESRLNPRIEVLNLYGVYVI